MIDRSARDTFTCIIIIYRQLTSAETDVSDVLTLRGRQWKSERQHRSCITRFRKEIIADTTGRAQLPYSRSFCVQDPHQVFKTSSSSRVAVQESAKSGQARIIKHNNMTCNGQWALLFHTVPPVSWIAAQVAGDVDCCLDYSSAVHFSGHILSP